MSKVKSCPTCGGKAKYKEQDGQVIYTKVEDEAAFKKIGQLKKAMMKYKEKADALEKEIASLKENQRLK